LIVAEKEKRATGDVSEPEVITRYTNWLKKKGCRLPTIKGKVSSLKALKNAGAELYDPESVKMVIAEKNCSEGRKQNLCYANEDYLEMMGGKWDRPIYKRRGKSVFIPVESELDDLIAGTGRKTSMLLQLMKETGIRVCESTYLTWDDIDFDAGTVDITPAKNSNPRKLNLSRNMLNRLSALRNTNNVKDPNRIFGKNTQSMRRLYSYQRKRIAYKLQNDRLNRITFHSLRHWRATMMIHLGCNITYVQYVLGHKSLLSTLRYIHIAEAHFNERIPRYVVESASSSEEAIPLIEEGYEKVDEFDGHHLYRKIKL